MSQVPGCPVNAGTYTNYRAILRSPSYPTSCSGYGFYTYSEDCPAGKTANFLTGQCEYACSDGQVHNPGGDGCIDKPPDCSSEQIAQMCGGSICTGTFQPPTLCWLSSASAPAGCESGTKFTEGCPQVCGPGQTVDPNTHACLDPTCPDGQTYVNGSCKTTLTCKTGFVANYTTGACEFNQCPDGYTTGAVNGQMYCAKRLQGTVQKNEHKTTQENSTVTTNSDGSISIQTTTDSDASSTSDVDIDTSGLAQEETMQGVEKGIKGLSQGDGKGKGAPGNGAFDPSVPAAASAEAEAEFNAALAAAKSGFSSLFANMLPAGGGELPIIDIGTIKGVPVVIDMNRYAGQLAIIGNVMVFAALVFAVYIVLG
ncbi:hypothetical protein [Methylomicrobium agile]|uniref:hypothetical protein n=1 Tax=Methylomicrobium agile TaxID=39774 RepID=UPI0014708219|nr:hypothetical protein [Methylomicrobium agile]